MALLAGQRDTLKNAGYRAERRDVTIKGYTHKNEMIVLTPQGDPVVALTKWKSNSPPSRKTQWDAAWSHYHRTKYGNNHDGGTRETTKPAR